MEPIELVTEFTVNGVAAREITAGDFVRRRGAFVTEMGFDDRDAECLANMLLQMAGACDRILVALYPWVEQVWQEISSSHWTEWHRHVFQRRLSFPRSTSWVIGSAQTAAKLLEVITWSWTLPGRDTLLFVVARTEDWRPLQALFEDDHEDDGFNERKLVAVYPTVISRGYKAMSARIVTREYDVAAVRALL
jgi:hypothetical protein